MENIISKYTVLLDSLERDLTDGFLNLKDTVYIVRTDFMIDGFYPYEKYFYSKKQADEYYLGFKEDITVEHLMFQLKAQIILFSKN